ncbi:MAG: YgiQ family radical SAM protein, partial [Bacteroidales bacterium]|nr:YgiQ family radical SAM protein [Bacteroidales bacterium]
LGVPRLCFCVSSGCMDSMVNHYTAAKRKRSDDAYTPGGQSGFRPDRATLVYSNILKELYPNTPVLIGGIEASMRRLAHYDYWDDKLMPSLLLDSKADMLIYGMGEKVVWKLCERLQNGEKIDQITDMEQTAYLCQKPNKVSKDWSDVYVPSYEQCKRDKKAQAESICIFEKHSNKSDDERLIQKYEKQNRYVVINPFDRTYSGKDLDEIYTLPFERKPHPKYAKRGAVPAFEMIKYSVNIHRGCFGGCAFCTIAAHQGKRIISRSKESIMQEIETIAQDKDFKGYLSDLGGPSANMYMMKGKNEDLCRKCSRPSCLFPTLCKNMNNNHKPLLELYASVRALPFIKKAFVGSGVRYDLFDDSNYFETLCRYHVSGRLKVAPEHSSDRVLKQMRKMSFKQFVDLKKRFDQINSRYGLNQQLIPYFISSHPACEMGDMVNLASQTAALGYRLQQVQDFTPTPMTIATETYYTGMDIYTKEKVFTEKNPAAKAMQNRIFFWYKPENRSWAKVIFKKYGERFPQR